MLRQIGAADIMVVLLAKVALPLSWAGLKHRHSGWHRRILQ
jgi:hypothetical protein